MPIFTLYHYAYFQKLCTYTKYNHTGLVDYDKKKKKKNVYVMERSSRIHDNI